MSGRMTRGLFACCVLSSTLAATTVIKLDTRGLVQRATRIVEAEVIETTCARDARGQIVTFVRLRVDAGGYWKGEGEHEFTLRFPGGIVREEGRGVHVPGMPVWTVGERTVLFVSDPQGVGSHAVVGLGQGKLRVVRDARTGAKRLVRSTAGLEFVEPGSGRPVEGPSSSIDVQDYESFKSQVSTLVNGGGK